MKSYVELFKQINKVTDNANIKVNEPMENHTSFRVGGPADILVTPNDVLEVQALIKICKKYKVTYYLIGNGSNLLVKDGGIRGVVIKLCNLNEIKVEGNKITAQSGASLYDVTMVALDKGLKGIEFASGIPGSIGGAAAMNAGAYDGEMSMVLDSVLAIDNNGELLTIYKDEMELSYRSSAVLKYGYTVISVTLNLHVGDKKVIKARMDDLAKKRSDKQPLEYASAGSTFKRPEGHYASVLIQDSNLKGTHIGDAEVSVKHSGFIINKNSASAKDILDLIKLVQNEVQEKFGVKLDTEVKILGEDKESDQESTSSCEAGSSSR